MPFFEQTAVTGEGPHAAELSLREFIEALREFPLAPVEFYEGDGEDEATAVYLRRDLLPANGLADDLSPYNEIAAVFDPLQPLQPSKGAPA